MKHFAIILLISAFARPLAHAVPVPKGKTAIPKGVRVVEMPGKKLTIRHVMRDDGPVVQIDVDGKTVEAKRIFIGDGQEAIEFEPDDKWVQALSQDGGKVGYRTNGGSFQNGGISMKRGKTHPFERMREGDVYIINSPFKVRINEDKGKYAKDPDKLATCPTDPIVR